MPVRAVDEFMVLHRIREVVEPLDGRRPEQRAGRHVACTLAQCGNHVGRILGGCRQTGVFEAVHAGLQATADLLRPVRVRNDRKPVLVRLVDDRRQFGVAHAVLVDQLHHVHAGLCDTFDFRARIGGRIHAPAELLGAGIGFFLDEGSGHEQGRPGDAAAVDRIAHGDAVLQRTAQVARTRHAGQQQLLRRRRHDHVPELGRVGLVPVVVVGVPIDHQVHVHVPQAGQHRHAFGRDDRRVRGHGQRLHRAYRNDALAFDQDDAVADRIAERAVDQGAAHHRHALRLRERRQRHARQHGTCLPPCCQPHRPSPVWKGAA